MYCFFLDMNIIKSVILTLGEVTLGVYTIGLGVVSCLIVCCMTLDRNLLEFMPRRNACRDFFNFRDF